MPSKPPSLFEGRIQGHFVTARTGHATPTTQPLTTERATLLARAGRGLNEERLYRARDGRLILAIEGAPSMFTRYLLDPDKPIKTERTLIEVSPETARDWGRAHAVVIAQ